MKTQILFLIAAIVGSPTARATHAATSPAATGCDRACLKRTLDSYLDAMTKHDASKLPVSKSVKFTENGRALKLGEGLWKTADAVTYRLYAIDPVGGQAAAEAVVRENGELANFLVRLKITGRKIAEVETILCRKGKGQQEICGPEKLTATPPLYLEVVPAAERSTRGELTAAADAYFTAIQTEGTPHYKPAPLAADANRFENGIQTTNVPIPSMNLPAASASEQLDKGWFKGLGIADRRYPVLDEEHGIALGIVLMPYEPGKSFLLAEMFKVSGGKIREIQAVLVDHGSQPTGWN